MSNDILLILIAGISSSITAVTGIGGGMMLIAIMPGFLPAAAIVPVHAVVQLFANSSRALFGWRFLRWEFVLAFIAGSVFGGAIAASITREINLEYTPLFIAAYILFIVWGPAPKFDKPPPGEFVVIGAIQTGLSMLVGATGPMSQAALMSRGLKRDALVVSGALMTTFTHLTKVVLFAILGFSFAEYWPIFFAIILPIYNFTIIHEHDDLISLFHQFHLMDFRRFNRNPRLSYLNFIKTGVFPEVGHFPAFFVFAIRSYIWIIMF